MDSLYSTEEDERATNESGKDGFDADKVVGIKESVLIRKVQR